MKSSQNLIYAYNKKSIKLFHLSNDIHLVINQGDLKL